MNTNRNAILDRISNLEEAIRKSREYLESRKHAQWSGFRPLFVPKLRDGEPLPPHPDWVKNVFLPSLERTLVRAEKAMERLSSRRTRRRTARTRRAACVRSNTGNW